MTELRPNLNPAWLALRNSTPPAQVHHDRVQANDLPSPVCHCVRSSNCHMEDWVRRSIGLHFVAWQTGPGEVLAWALSRGGLCRVECKQYCDVYLSLNCLQALVSCGANLSTSTITTVWGSLAMLNPMGYAYEREPVGFRVKQKSIDTMNKYPTGWAKTVSFYPIESFLKTTCIKENRFTLLPTIFLSMRKYLTCM